jgi:hypothetical protein
MVTQVTQKYTIGEAQSMNIMLPNTNCKPTEPEISVDNVLEQTLEDKLKRCYLIATQPPFTAILGPSCWIVPDEAIAARYRHREPDILTFSQAEFARLIDAASEGTEAMNTVIKAKRMFHGIIQ